MNPKLAQIPPEYLWLKARTDPSRAKRVRKLAKWCDAHGIRPTFAELEAERDRRRAEHLEGA